MANHPTLLLGLAAFAIAIAVPSGRPVAGVVALGLVGGAGLALHAMGVVLVYRSDRFVNLAQVQVGLAAAVLFTTLVRARPLLRGVVRVCPPCIERVTPTIDHVNYVVSLAIALAAAVAISWLIHATVVRRFATAPRLVLTVASIFVIQMLIGLQRLIDRYLTTAGQRASGRAHGAAPPPTGADVTLTVGGVQLHLPDLVLAGAAVAAVVGIGMLLRLTSTGTAIRAASEDGERAASLGVDVARVAGRVWMLAGLLAGIAGIALASTVGVGGPDAGTTVSLLARIMVVAVLARLTSLPLAIGGGLVIGVLDQAVLAASGTSLPTDGALVVIITAALLLQRRLATRSDAVGPDWAAAQPPRPLSRASWQLPAIRDAARWGGLLAAAAVLAYPWIMSPSQTASGSVVLIHAVVGMSLLVLTGWAGQVSLGQFALAAVGGYVVATTKLPLVLALPVGGLAGAAVAVAVGLPALKLRGLHLAISTLALALAVPAVLLNPRYLGKDLAADLARPRLLGFDLGDERTFYYVCIVVLVLAVAVVAGLRRSRSGRALIAARDNEPAVQALGIGLVRLRLEAFAVAGFLAAAAGVMLAFSQGGVRAETYSPEASLTVFTFAVLGGLGSITGVLLGFLWFGILTITGANPLVLALASGAGGLALLLAVPGGLGQIAFSWRDALVRRADRRLQLAQAGGGWTGERIPVRAPGPAGAEADLGRYVLDGQWAIAPELDRG